ncbi:Pathogenicity locus [Paenibacillus selenitireducens]|uniref:Pathogenicity locus n=1 Tax=Paenibacillus selenitireducens TaxID=1324314 RepID=A0A1T2X649_9BACL|nr:helix-hairpin-helix domain-containing protein [Paenibacillus selenitireducens]OPA75354.1 Pathogenicity locus [Paenibacillus selenitireducens]
MKNNKTPKLDLTISERSALRKCKIKTSEIKEYSIHQLSSLLSISVHRARDLKALTEFQSIPSIGPKFAQDLMQLGFYALDDLVGKDGAFLIEELEQLHGIRIDPCVEDQFRLVVHYASNRDSNKQWWDFTEERKQYREQYGYPVDRP